MQLAGCPHIQTAIAVMIKPGDAPGFINRQLISKPVHYRVTGALVKL
jgi:hypothetical protein